MDNVDNDFLIGAIACNYVDIMDILFLIAHIIHMGAVNFWRGQTACANVGQMGNMDKSFSVAHIDCHIYVIFNLNELVE